MFNQTLLDAQHHAVESPNDGIQLIITLVFKFHFQVALGNLGKACIQFSKQPVNIT